MFQPCWWVTAKSSHLRHEFDNLPIGAHLAFEPFKKVSLWYLIWGFGLVICWFCGDNFDVGSNLHSHLFLYVASSAFESIMTAIYPFWESLKNYSSKKLKDFHAASSKENGLVRFFIQRRPNTLTSSITQASIPIFLLKIAFFLALQIAQQVIIISKCTNLYSSVLLCIFIEPICIVRYYFVN
ncbi:hypothetical protein HanIR_Chr16g0831861 [Helianthus annuus]|uniref:uncharacterized protein LOC110917658 n=1 Tax=Helianthus annuus TaxID=4232 RepID=UPI001652FE7A|nr:uncharacterized protein LOC110917658 [Helianthus annuus]KAJ0444440.1 hypothetical protein HanIR_Chr16g0831861 [Helianthus annuus]